MKASLASDRLRGSGADSEAGSGSTARPPETSRSSGLQPSGQDQIFSFALIHRAFKCTFYIECTVQSIHSSVTHLSLNGTKPYLLHQSADFTDS